MVCRSGFRRGKRCTQGNTCPPLDGPLRLTEANPGLGLRATPRKQASKIELNEKTYKLETDKCIRTGVDIYIYIHTHTYMFCIYIYIYMCIYIYA